MPRVAKKNKATERLSLKMTPAVKKRLTLVRERIGAETYAEVVRRALATFDFIVQETQAGGEVVVFNAEGERTKIWTDTE